MAGTDDIAAERARQIEAEGWTPDRDDEYICGQLARAATCYAYRAGWPESGGPSNEVSHLWPWHKSWWKPTDRRRDLVKAGALIAAEIDRLDRAKSDTTK